VRHVGSWQRAVGWGGGWWGEGGDWRDLYCCWWGCVGAVGAAAAATVVCCCCNLQAVGKQALELSCKLVKRNHEQMHVMLWYQGLVVQQQYCTSA
jgi:hypothetical protein